MDASKRNQYRELIRKYNVLMREYEELIAAEEFADDEIWLPPPFSLRRPVVIERSCAFAKNSDRYLEMLTAPGQRAAGLKELRDFSDHTESMIIVDPYIYSGASANADAIAQDLKLSIRASGKNLKRLHIIYDPSEKNTTKAVRKKIHEVLEEQKIFVTEKPSDVLHDRIWIADRSRAKVVGTSLNGIGGRLSFILPLPKDDLVALLNYLDENGLSRADA